MNSSYKVSRTVAPILRQFVPSKPIRQTRRFTQHPFSHSSTLQRSPFTPPSYQQHRFITLGPRLTESPSPQREPTSQPDPPRETDTLLPTTTTSSTPPIAQVPSYQITFTCRPCQTRSSHLLTKQGYHHGTVLITCPSCHNRHVITDHLRVFQNEKSSLEDILRRKAPPGSDLAKLLKKGKLGIRPGEMVGREGEESTEFYDDGTEGTFEPRRIWSWRTLKSEKGVVPEGETPRDDGWAVRRDDGPDAFTKILTDSPPRVRKYGSTKPES